MEQAGSVAENGSVVYLQGMDVISLYIYIYMKFLFMDFLFGKFSVSVYLYQAFMLACIWHQRYNSQYGKLKAESYYKRLSLFSWRS
jgi:hypothetical protein